MKTSLTTEQINTVTEKFYGSLESDSAFESVVELVMQCRKSQCFDEAFQAASEAGSGWATGAMLTLFSLGYLIGKAEQYHEHHRKSETDYGPATPQQ
jgi:hypothetical protein